MNDNIYEGILQGLDDAIAFQGGDGSKAVLHKVDGDEEVDPKAVRAKLGMSQSKFAEIFGFTLNSIKNWEIGRREPNRMARIYLKLIEKDPTAVLRIAAK